MPDEQPDIMRRLREYESFLEHQIGLEARLLEMSPAYALTDGSKVRENAYKAKSLYEFCLRVLYERFPELKLQETTTEELQEAAVKKPQ